MDNDVRSLGLFIDIQNAVFKHEAQPIQSIWRAKKETENNYEDA